LRFVESLFIITNSKMHVEPTVDCALALVYTISGLAPLIFLYAGMIYVVVFVNKYCKRRESLKL